ncbi:MAG TPA: exodeoxyribonuclease III [Dongiaceae bacterium]|jgi:exodeoxyribonuclease-3|nr:exodeoxyribonuclease III [Dongiaceae bacterium]
MPVIASFNVNSLRARLIHVLDWLKTAKPDVALLQEIKCQDHDMPIMEIEELGYNTAVCGQKSYNGVAILSRSPLHIERRGLPNNGDDDQARYIEAVIDNPEGKRHKAFRVASIYVPNGNPVGTEKYPYKLRFMERLAGHARQLLALEEPVVLGGDYNVAPADIDVYDPVAWRDDALCLPETRAKFRTLLHAGYVDALRAMDPASVRYTFWDYQQGRWQHDQGLRIDHLLLSPQAADRLSECAVDRAPRAGIKPSDHTPIWCRLDL